MGLAILKIKLMPKSPDTNLDELENKAKKIIESDQGSNIRFERTPIAFGLTASEVLFTREETLDSDDLVEKLKNLEDVNSAKITDFRRAFG